LTHIWPDDGPSSSGKVAASHLLKSSLLGLDLGSTILEGNILTIRSRLKSPELAEYLDNSLFALAANNRAM